MKHGIAALTGVIQIRTAIGCAKKQLFAFVVIAVKAAQTLPEIIKQMNPVHDSRYRRSVHHIARPGQIPRLT